MTRACTPHVADGRDYWFTGGVVADEIAKAICDGCPARAVCAAKGANEAWGVWGGVADWERLGELLLATPEPPEPVHSYAAGCRCARCREAHSARIAEWRHRERGAATASETVVMPEQLELGVTA